LLKKLAEAKEQMSTTVSNGSIHALDGKPDASEKKEGSESGMVRALLFPSEFVVAERVTIQSRSRDKNLEIL